MSEHAPEIAVNHTGIVIVRVLRETYRENPTSFIPNRFIIEHPVAKLRSTALDDMRSVYK